MNLRQHNPTLFKWFDFNSGMRFEIVKILRNLEIRQPKISENKKPNHS